MQIDVGTIYLAGGLAGVIASGAMYTGNRISSRHDGVGFLTLALLLLGVASALLGLQREVGDWLALGLGNTLLAASALAFWLAMRPLRGAQTDTRVPQFTVALVCLVEWASLIADTSVVVRACVGAAGTAVAFAFPVLTLLRRSEPWMERGRMIAASAFVVAAAASLVRAVAVWSDPASVAFTTLSPVNLVFAIATLGLVAATAVSILVMLREHQRSRLQMLDGLTEVFNRGAFLDQAKRVLSLGQRRDLACSAVLVNLDRFSRVNEMHGVRAGDEVLQYFATRARGVLRPEDLIGRSAGSEFALLLFATPATGAQAVARRLKTTLAAHPPRVRGVAIALTASFGIAEWRPGDALDAIELLQRADRAVHAAKMRGRDTIVRYEELDPAAAAP